MRHVQALPSFLRTVKRLNRNEKDRLNSALKTFAQFLISGEAPYGFRLKKLKYNIFEFRIDIKSRVLVKIEEEICYLIIYGNHDEIRKYLKKTGQL